MKSKNRKSENDKPSQSELLDQIKKIVHENDLLKLDNHQLKVSEKELRVKNDELNSLKENYDASLEEARAITEELEKQNKNLIENEAKFRTLNEIVPVAIFIIQNNKFVYYNRKFLEIIEYDSQQLENLSFGDLLHPNHITSLKKIGLFGQSIKISPVRFEIQILSNNGIKKWVDFSAANFEYEGKNAILCSALNITLKKSAEKSLKITQFSVDKASDSILWLKKDGSFIYVNDTACNMLGYSFEQFMKLKIFDIAPEFPKKLWPRHWQNLKEKTYMVFETLHRTKKGIDIPVETAVNFLEVDGEEYNFAFSRDITERKNNELLLIESEEQFRNIFNSTNEAIFIHEKETGKIIDLNEATCQMFGFNYEDIFNLSPDNLSLGISPYSAKEALEAIQKAGNEGPQTFRWLSKNSQGKLFDTEVSLKLAKIGKKERIIAVVRDISKRIKAEEALIKAKNRAEESDRLKSAFLANMSHEIRTPMNGILGFTELLHDENINEKDRKFYLSIIQQNGNQLLNLINDILDVSKIEVGQLKLSYEWLNVSSLFAELETTFKQLVIEKQKQIKIRGQNQLGNEYKIKCDPVRLRQILYNLLSNALKFTDTGSIEFGCKNENKDFLFWVKDTGIGLSKQEQSLIFERFMQINNSHSKTKGGTGLGLSIIKGLIELMNGKIWVVSEPEKGSSFYFTIPTFK